MQQGLLPLFPLQVVLFPGGSLPLHIFEERYKEMIGEAIRDKSEFGVVLANEKGIVDAGCTAVVDQLLRQFSDGRLDVLTKGRRRFEIQRLNDERPFLRGEVEYFDDDDASPAPDELRQRVMEEYSRLQALGATEPLDASVGQERQISFRLAQSVTDLGFRQKLLSLRSEGERLRQIADYLPAFVLKQKRVQHIKNIAPRNGHGHMDGLE